ncbi:MAG: SRPBCC domain-containing protein [Deltaproteobacteria bacterium]|nr:SRPBCC domain-containing protein [Deltaproteobacteria bacterium]
MNKRINAKLTMAAAPQRLFRALTSEQELTRWFCEHADVSLEAQRYDFWGRFTPEAPERDCGHHPLLALEPDRRLTFSWWLCETETTVDVCLEIRDESTQVTLVHEGVPAPQPGEAHLADFWALSLENLRSWVERGVVGPRCDFSAAPHGDVGLSIDIAASREAVYDALIRPAELERYIATHAAVEPRIGGHYSFGWKEGGAVKILELKPEERLSYSWSYEDQPDTVVTWTLEGSGGRTRLTLVHSGFARDRKNGGYHAGWLKFLNRLKNLVELGGRWQQPILRVTDSLPGQ